MTFIINPGSGPVQDHTPDHASANIAAFLEDLGEGWAIAGPVPWPPKTDDGTGRYRATLRAPSGRIVEIDMPGIPLDKVRFVDGDDQNIWDFPRLYVDGSSWVWCFAVSAAAAEPEDDQ